MCFSSVYTTDENTAYSSGYYCCYSREYITVELRFYLRSKISSHYKDSTFTPFIVFWEL